MLMRLKGINPVTVRRGDKTYRYFYHRATGARIKASWGTPEFVAEVAKLNEAAKAKEARPGSLDALMTAYRRSPEFTDLAPRTRSDYEKVFDYLAPLSDMPLVEVDAAFIYGLRDKAYKKRRRRFANYVVQVVRLLLGWGKPRGFLETNPATEIKSIRRPKGMARANRPWADDERETVLEAASIELRAMIAQAMFAGLREGDACVTPRLAYDGKRIETIANKNGEPIWIPAHYRLREILDAALVERKAKMLRRARRRKILPLDPPTLCVTSRGTAWTESGLRASFFGLIGELTAAGKVRPGLTFHGLRHTLGKLVIEAGGTKEDVGMILSDRSLAMAEFYSREHDKTVRVAATVLRLEQSERDKTQNRADVVAKQIRGKGVC